MYLVVPLCLWLSGIKWMYGIHSISSEILLEYLFKIKYLPNIYPTVNFC